MANDFVQLNITIVREKLVARCWDMVDLHVCCSARLRLPSDVTTSAWLSGTEATLVNILVEE